MRKWLLLIAAVLGVGLVSSIGFSVGGGGKETQPEPKIATNRIVKVVVYPTNALVTRDVDVPAGSGLSELVVSPLPAQFVGSSLYSEGANGIRVLSTRFRTRQVYEDAREEVRKAEDERYKLELAAEKLQADMKAVQENMSMIGKLEGFTSVTTVNATEKGGLNGDTVITMSKYVMEQRNEKSKELVTLKQQLKENGLKKEFVNRKLGELSAGATKTERDAVIVIDRDQAGAGKVRLNYLVDHVTWAPQYKLRAGKPNENVQIDYLAALVQQTGEDWNGVEMTLSTAQPMLNAAPPELRKVEISVIPRTKVPGIPKSGPEPAIDGASPPQPIMHQAQPPAVYQKKADQLRSEAEKLGQTAGKNKLVDQALNDAAALEQTLDLIRSPEEMAGRGRGKLINEGPSVSYHLKHKLSLPSRNDEQVVEVARLSLAPKFYYKSVPVLSQNVYRLADLVNKSDLVLLPGEATMYLGLDFVGRMSMPLVAVGEEFTAGFGVDPQLQIQRMMMDKNRTTQGGNQVLKYDYRILVNSYKTEKVQVQVWDRLPLALEMESTGISLLKVAPELSKDALYLREQRPNNLLRWDLEVEPSMSGEKALMVNYQFRLELDKQMLINQVVSK